MNKKFSDFSPKNRLYIVIGVGFIVVGTGQLFVLGFGSAWWETFRSTSYIFFNYAWPVALVAAGVYLLWAARAGRLEGALAGHFYPPLGRSSSDKRVAGVCGGLAHFLGIDPTIVRVVVVILGVASPLFCLVAYALAVIFLPRI